MAEGWIRLHRILLEWEWYATPNMAHFFVYCLLKATYKERTWQGIHLSEGQFISGRKIMAKELGLTEQEVRTCIYRLKSTNELTSTAHSKFSVFTVISWNKYQINETANQQNNQQVTSFQPASNQQVTTDKNVKNKKNDKNERINTNTPKAEPSEFVEFYSAYPKKIDRQGALKSFLRAIKKTTLGTMLLAIEKQKHGEGWQQSDGKYIPHPTTWLNQERWSQTVEIEDTQSWASLNRQLLEGATDGQDHLAIGRDF